MKKIIFTLLLSLFILPAFADATWEEFTNKNKTFYIDTSSMTNNGSKYLYWIKSQNTSNGYKKMFIHSDCANNMTAIQKVLTYNTNDKLIKTQEPRQELTFVVPDSDAQAAYNYVCKIYNEAKKKEANKKNAITPNKIFNTINAINNAGYEVNSIKNNALNVINGF